MFDFLGKLVAGHPWKFIGLWVILAGVLGWLAPNWDGQSQDDDIRFLPAHYPSVRGYQLLEQAFPKDVEASRAILAIERADGPLTGDDLRLVDQLVQRLRQLQLDEPKLQISGVHCYRDGPVGSRLMSKDRQCTLITLALATPYLASQTRTTVDRVEKEIRPMVDAAGPGAPWLFVTGPAGVGRDLVRASTESLDHTTWATIILIIVVLLLVYRSPLLALIPLVTIGLAVFVSIQILSLAASIPGVHLVNVSQVFLIVILFGAGTDYCLFLISRHREELEFGHRPETGVARAVRCVGGALTASAATVICGLGTMGFAEFGKIRSAGPVIGVGLLVGLFATLTLTPALLRLGGKFVFWPHRIQFNTSETLPSFWSSISQWVVKRPGLTFALSTLPLLPLALLGTQIIPSFKPTGDLSPVTESVRGLAVIQNHFTAGETGPLTILLVAKQDWNSVEGRKLVQRLSQGFMNLPNIAEVRSLTQPLGRALDEPPPVVRASSVATKKPFNLVSFIGNAREKAGNLIQTTTRNAAESHYTRKIGPETQPEYVTRIDVVFHSDPFEGPSIDTFGYLEAWMQDLLPQQSSSFGEVRAESFGVTVHSRDMGKVVARDRLRVNLLVTIGVFLILIVVVKRLWLAAFLLATVLLSYAATLGLTALYATWLTDRPLGVIEWRVPFFLFTILVAIGEDYNILLVTRILQERKRHGLVEGVRRSLAFTGGTITACGLIMAGTFGTLMLTDLSTLKQIGFALAVGVLLDTFIVRPFMVPSFLLLVWGEADPVSARRHSRETGQTLMEPTAS